MADGTMADAVLSLPKSGYVAARDAMLRGDVWWKRSTAATGDKFAVAMTETEYAEARAAFLKG